MSIKKISLFVVLFGIFFVCIWRYYEYNPLTPSEYMQKIYDFKAGKIDADELIDASAQMLSNAGKDADWKELYYPLFVRSCAYYLRGGPEDLDLAQADLEAAIAVAPSEQHKLLSRLYLQLASILNENNNLGSQKFAKTAEAMAKSAEYERDPAKRSLFLETAKLYDTAARAKPDSLFWYDFFFYKDKPVDILGVAAGVDHMPNGSVRVLLDYDIVCEIAEGDVGLENLPLQDDVVIFSGICRGVREGVITLADAKLLQNVSAFTREKTPSLDKIISENSSDLIPVEN